MNASAAFDERKDLLLAQLEGAANAKQAAAAAAMALEQTACALAQDEQDEWRRQRQQAVMAVARYAPQMLTAAKAQGEIVLRPAAPEKDGGKKKLVTGVKTAGIVLLSALALFEAIDGRWLFAAVQAAGGALLAYGLRSEAQDTERTEARGVLTVQPKEVVLRLSQLCQAVDICMSDLALVERDAGMNRLCGTADDAMLDLLQALMEAKASGRDELAMRSLAQAEQYLHMQGIEMVYYDAQNASKFDILPTLGEARTIRPAFVQDGKLLRRGAAACREEARA